MTTEREKVIHAAALEAYYRARLSGPINPDMRMREALDAVRPLIAADALREAADGAEKISMVYDQDSDDGWRAWMRQRAETLEQSRRCIRCGALVHRIPCPTGDWWAHIDHPADNHTAWVRDEQ